MSLVRSIWSINQNCDQLCCLSLPVNVKSPFVEAQSSIPACDTVDGFSFASNFYRRRPFKRRSSPRTDIHTRGKRSRPHKQLKRMGMETALVSSPTASLLRTFFPFPCPQGPILHPYLYKT